MCLYRLKKSRVIYTVNNNYFGQGMLDYGLKEILPYGFVMFELLIIF